MKVPQITKTSGALQAKFWVSITFYLVGCRGKTQPECCFRKQSVAKLAIAIDAALYSQQNTIDNTFPKN